MAQTPATPKARRARLLLLSALLGPERLLQRDDALQGSERAALALRRTPPMAAATTAVFLIPLVGQHHVKDWPGTSARLGDTLNSLLAQSDPNWTAIICGQDRPDTLPDDPRIIFLPFAETVQGNDKWRKLSALTRALPDHAPQAGYAMTFDADDIAHPGMVAEMLQTQAPGGYLVETGYVLDKGACAIGLAGPRGPRHPLRKPFWKLCGSCAALRYDLANGAAEVAFLREMSQHEHRMFPYLAKLAGRTLQPLSRPMVTYLLNHGDNFGARRGRVGFKTRFVQRYRITDPAEVDRIVTEFSLKL